MTDLNILWLWFGVLSIAMLPLLWLLVDSFRNPRPWFHKPLNWPKSKAESESGKLAGVDVDAVMRRLADK